MHVGSYSRCLDELAPSQVLLAVEEALAIRTAGESGSGGGASAQRPVKMV
jgi:hypothetical protein